MYILYARDLVYKGLVLSVFFYCDSAVLISGLAAVIEVILVLIRLLSVCERHKAVCCGGCTDKVIVIGSA